MANNVVLNKASTIERCIDRIQEEYGSNPKNLENYTKQDSIILNIQRACEASIDLAMYLVAQQKLGVPQSSREGFDLLFEGDFIDKELSERMKAMVGFRNIAVHDYKHVNLDIVQQIIEKHLDDFLLFKRLIIKENP
ncbi:MAG TPA: DUF86 domain-containing protein [Bacillota bacterium]|nr:DUF86 domain-containing protein [Bacillota bacterium]